MTNDGPFQYQKALLTDVLMRDDIDAFELLLQKKIPLNEPFSLSESEVFENMTPLQAAFKVHLLESGCSKILMRMLAYGSDLNINHVISEHKDSTYDLKGFTALTMVAAFADMKAQCGLVKRLIEIGADINKNSDITLAHAVYSAIKINNYSLVDLYSQNGVRIGQATFNFAQILRMLKLLPLKKLKALMDYGLKFDLNSEEVLSALIENTHLGVLPYFEKNGLSKIKVAEKKLVLHAKFNALLNDLNHDECEINLSHQTLKLMINGLKTETLCAILSQLIKRARARYHGINESIAIEGVIPVLAMLRDCAEGSSDIDEARLSAAKTYFDSQALDKKDKSYILTLGVPSEHDLSKLSHHEIAKLFQQDDIISQMSEAARIVVVSHLRRKDTQFEEYSSYAQMQNMTKRVGHIFGMSSKIAVKVDKREIEFNPGGHFTENMLHDLVKLLEEYRLKSPSNQILEINETLKLTASLLDGNDYKHAASQKLIERYKQNRMVLLSAGWRGHQISILLYQDLMVICNRGDHGDQKYGALMYQFSKNFELTEANIADLIVCHQSSRQLLDEIDKLLQEAALVAEFSLASQKHPNCSFANFKSMLAPMLYLLYRPRIDKTFDMIVHFVMSYNNKGYKEITSFFRDKIVDEIIDRMGKSLGKLELVQYYTVLLAALMDEKYKDNPKTDKAKADQQRLIKLYQNAPARIKKGLAQNKNYMQKLFNIYTTSPTFKIEKFDVKIERKESKKQSFVPSFLSKRPKVHPKLCRVSKPLNVRY